MVCGLKVGEIICEGNGSSVGLSVWQSVSSATRSNLRPVRYVFRFLGKDLPLNRSSATLLSRQ